jgi:hypothetical protein
MLENEEKSEVGPEVKGEPKRLLLLAKVSISPPMVGMKS